MPKFSLNYNVLRNDESMTKIIGEYSEPVLAASGNLLFLINFNFNKLINYLYLQTNQFAGISQRTSAILN